jgi:hypothetical protein
VRRHRKSYDDATDTRVDGRVPDGDRVLQPGYARWSDLMARHGAPLVNPDPDAELVRPYDAKQGRRWWPR